MRIKKYMAGTAFLFLTAACTACNPKSDDKTATVAVNYEKNGQSETDNTQQAEKEIQTTTAQSQESGVNVCSLYINHKELGKRIRSDSYSSSWVKGEDIVSFEAYATVDEEFSLTGSNFKNVWEDYWNKYPGYDKCKIGYTVDFYLKDGTKIHQTITSPDDVFGFRNYLECYLYDDVNQVQGNWYSHLLSSQVTDQTVMTSIKFTAGQDMEKMGDIIRLTAFVYTSPHDFNEQGEYIGKVSTTAMIKNQ